MSGLPLTKPQDIASVPANGQHAGYMPRWYARDATHASFATAQVGSHSDLYVPLATTTLAGAQSATDKAKLDALALPNRATLWHDESAVVTGGAIVRTHDALQNYATYSTQTGPANGDIFEQTFVIGAGTYTFSVLGIATNISGKVDWYFDGVALITGQDWYAAATTYNVVVAVGSVALAAGLHTLRGQVNGKNAASGGFNLPFTKLWLR